ncbi:MAG: hypothetical protein ACLPX1_13155 [Steroidobacteraceae bacterium]
MSKGIKLHHLLGLAAALAGAALPAAIAWADVTETKTSTFNASIMKINSTDTERYSGDKKRTDSETRCDGFLMSRLCGDIKGGEIIRLDKDLTWTLEPAKKEYLEKPFPTPEQRAEARQKAEEMMAKLKSCPAPTPTPQPTAPDTSKCDMSPPKFEIKQTDDTGFFAGHQARRSTVTMTQTCTNKQTGDACDIILGVDSWLTQDEIPGAADVRAFHEAYAKKLGLDETAQAIKPQMQALLAPYMDALRQAGGKTGDFKGYPLKTSISIAMGGEHCQAAKSQPQGASGGGTVASATGAATEAAESSTTSAAGAAAAQAAGQSGGIAGSIAGSAAGAFGSKLMSGLFAKKTPPPAKPDASATTPAQAGKPVPLVEWSIETTSIGTEPIASSQFELPADWKLDQPKPQKEREFQCPTPGK